MTDWIDVAERMPDDDTNVIVASDTEAVFSAYWDGDSWLSPEECRRIRSRITHWMPLPEPPQ